MNTIFTCIFIYIPMHAAVDVRDGFRKKDHIIEIKFRNEHKFKILVKNCNEDIMKFRVNQIASFRDIAI